MDSVSQNSTSAVKSTGVLVLGLFVSIVVCFAAGGIGAIATNSSVNGWYAGINKPSWNPPNWIFGPVWSTLFFMMGVSAWLVWKESGFGKARFALGWFAFHLVLNTLWSLLFFGMQEMGWAFAEILLLWAAILFAMSLFAKHSRTAALLLMPYLLWVSFATYLNFTIWQMN